MSSCLIELHLLPNIAYFSKLIKFEKVTVEAHENYLKGSFRNKFEIVNATGKQLLSIPLNKGKHQQMPIQKVGINYDTPWQKKHWQSIKTAYGKAPYWDYYQEEFKEEFFKKEKYLFDYNLNLLKKTLELLNLKMNLQLSENYIESASEECTDLRNSFKSPNYMKEFIFKPYTQVFFDRLAFQANVSCIDAIFCLGPEANHLFQE